MRWLLLAIVLYGCSPPRKERAIMDYASHCYLRMGQNREFHKELPMIEQNGTIIVYDDSICFQSKSDSLAFVLDVVSFSGDMSFSRLVCRSRAKEIYIFMVEKQRFNPNYDVCFLAPNSGHYFNVHKVR